MTEKAPIVDDLVIDFIGELYLHEDKEFKKRVNFGDYLKIALRAYPDTTLRPAFVSQYHVHWCCGKWVMCERPHATECDTRPQCLSHTQEIRATVQ